MSTVETDSPRRDLRRAGERWSQQENEQLVLGLRAGLLVEQLAADHGRSVTAILARASAMVPQGEQWPSVRRERVDWLRERLAEGKYDWEPVLAAATRTTGAWTDELDEELRAAWDAGRPMVEIIDELQRSEVQIVRRLHQLELTTSVVEIVERMGCRRRGNLAARRSIALGMDPTEVKLLIGVDHHGKVVHASAHAPQECTSDLRERVLRDHLTGPDVDYAEVFADQGPGLDGVLTWTELTRQIGGQGYTDPHLQ